MKHHHVTKHIFKSIFFIFVNINILFANDSTESITNELIKNGLLASKEQRFSEAKLFFKNACELKNYDGCYFLASIYDGVIPGAEENVKVAFEYYKQSCNGLELHQTGAACYALGLAYDTGRGIKKSHTKAIESYSKACKLGDGTSCFNLGSIYYQGSGVKKDKAKAYYFFKKSCDFGNEDGCNNEQFILQN